MSKRFISLAMLVLLVTAMAVILPGVLAQGDDSLECTEDGSNGIQCGTPADNECNPGGVLAWEYGWEGPCPAHEEVWVCGWYLARVNRGYLDAVPDWCEWAIPPEPEPEPAPAAEKSGPGNNWTGCFWMDGWNQWSKLNPGAEVNVENNAAWYDDADCTVVDRTNTTIVTGADETAALANCAVVIFEGNMVSLLVGSDPPLWDCVAS